MEHDLKAIFHIPLRTALFFNFLIWGMVCKTLGNSTRMSLANGDGDVQLVMVVLLAHQAKDM
jgi:hypothetical protein